MSWDSEAAGAWGALAGLAMFMAAVIVVACMFCEYTVEARIYRQYTGEPQTMFDEMARDLRFKQPTTAPYPPRP